MSVADLLKASANKSKKCRAGQIPQRANEICLTCICQHFAFVADIHICVVTCFHEGTDINDKVRGNLNTPALMKMLNTSEPDGLLATPRLEDTSITSLETPLSNQDKMMLGTPLRLSLTLECDMYESDVMLDTLSDTST